MPRDDFLESTKTKLRERVANRCSKPDCRVPTSAAAKGSKINRIGVAAHICAAAENGPRYDPTMTPEERKSIDNAIHLCSNHATEIDSDPLRYSPDLLRRWKRKAEEQSRQELGKKLPAVDEVRKAVYSVLVGQPASEATRAIENVHRASESHLNSIDKRLKVFSSYNNGVSSTEIRAVDSFPMSLRFEVPPPHSKEVVQRWTMFNEHGEDFQVKADNVEFSGSKLFDELFKKGKGTIQISSIKHRGVLNLELTDDKENTVFRFDTAHGEFSIGEKGGIFKSELLEGLIKLICKFDLSKGYSKSKFDFTFDLTQWEKRDISTLPYFDKLLLVCQLFMKGHKLSLNFEVKGDELFSGKVEEDFSVSEAFIGLDALLSYTKLSRTVNDFLNASIEFTSDFSFSKEELKNLNEMCNIALGENDYDFHSFKGTLSSTSEFESLDYYDKYLEDAHKGKLRYVIEEQVTLSLFAKEVVLPTIQKVITGFDLRIKTKDVLDNGKVKAEVTLLPLPEFKFIEAFKSEA